MKANIFIVLLMVIVVTACAQKKTEEIILGKWAPYKTTDLNDDSLSSPGVVYSIKDNTLMFKEDGVLYDYVYPGSPPEEDVYKIVNDSILIMGNRSYILHILDENRISMDEYYPDKPYLDPYRLRFYYKRVE